MGVGKGECVCLKEHFNYSVALGVLKMKVVHNSHHVL